MGKKRKPTIYPYQGERVKQCKFCPVMIYWRKMDSGKNMPVERDTYEPHWGNCPGASKARKKKEGTADGKVSKD